jgi:hypothetical protein
MHKVIAREKKAFTHPESMITSIYLKSSAEFEATAL